MTASMAAHSCYTLQAVSYIIDVYRGQIEAQRNVLNFGTYITMFPPLIAGPIVRYATVEEQILRRRESLELFADGLRLFAVGLAKKVLLANVVAVLATETLSLDPSAIGVVGAWLGLLAYAFQIYFDFAGYSDMAIGLGKMFGFTYLRNFNYPYISKSATEFWRRWHISLSSFFRDYVYIPLGGSRVSRGRWIFNIFVVWSLTGLWHGAAWNFVLWGLFYGILLANAALQRVGISQAAALFGFDAYPTFYGSDYAYLPSEQVVCAISTQFVSSNYTYTAESLAEMIDKNPALNFYLYVPARQSTAYHKTSASFVSDPRSPKM